MAASTAQASMAMSCVAEASVKVSRKAVRSVPTFSAGSSGMTKAIAASAPRQGTIQARRGPKRSMSGAQSGFHDHGSASRLISPISFSDTPWARK